MQALCVSESPSARQVNGVPPSRASMIISVSNFKVFVHIFYLYYLCHRQQYTRNFNGAIEISNLHHPIDYMPFLI